MEKIKFPYFSDQTDEIVIALNHAINNIKTYYTLRQQPLKNKENFNELLETIISVTEYWTGNTWVGSLKEENVKNAFQEFFLELEKIIIFLENNSTFFLEKEFANKIKYRGIVYRYLGSDNSNNKKRILPRYDGVFASWSKNKGNSYIESKLYGPMTLITCEIKEPYWGIDLEWLGVSKGEEKEVVFPLKRDFVQKVEFGTTFLEKR